ncbi:MAG TPA: thioredoxin family protein [Bacillota bacterium]
MLQVTDEILQKDHFLLYIHTPFCGTCHVARSMLDQIEKTHRTHIFYEMNASLFPQFMHDNKVESVPCLLIKDKGEVKEKVYAFRSIANIYRYLLTYEPHLFRSQT